jgi:hypothetical protein
MQRMLATTFAISTLAVFAAACHPGAVINADPQPVGGTIAGIVRATDGAVPLMTRQVTATNVTSGTPYVGTTGPNGGYTIKVPEGTYRIDVEVRDGEVVAKKPDQIEVNNSDLDSGLDFEITVKPAR